MSSATEIMLTERLALYLAAEKTVLEGAQSWESPDGMSYTRSNLNALQREIKNIRQELAQLTDVNSYGAQTFSFQGRY